MTNEDLTKTVMNHISTFLETDLGEMTPDDNLADSVDGLTSAKMVELILYLEECFGFEFDENVADQLNSVRDLVSYIEKNMARSKAVV